MKTRKENSDADEGNKLSLISINILITCTICLHSLFLLKWENFQIFYKLLNFSKECHEFHTEFS